MPFALPPCFCYRLDTPSAFTLSQCLLCSSARLLRRRKYRYHMGVTAWVTAYLGVQPCSRCVRHIVLIKSVLVCWLVFSLTFSDVLVTSDVCFGFLLLFIFFFRIGLIHVLFHKHVSNGVIRPLVYIIKCSNLLVFSAVVRVPECLIRPSWWSLPWPHYLHCSFTLFCLVFFLCLGGVSGIIC